MMTNRSSHIPTLMNIAMTQRAQTFERTCRNQRSCGTTMLQRIRSQYWTAYGPVEAVQDHEPLELVAAVEGGPDLERVAVGDDEARSSASPSPCSAGGGR